MRQLLLRGSLVSFVLQAVGALLIFASEVLLARVLGAAHYGVFATVMAWLQLLTIVGLLGSNYLLLRFVPVYVEEQAWGLLRGILRLGWMTGLALAVMVYVLVPALLKLLAPEQSSLQFWAFVVGLGALPFYVLSAQRQAILRGLHRIFSALAPEYVVRPLVLIGLLLAFYFGSQHEVEAPQALGMNLVAALLAFALGWLWQRRAMPKPVSAATPDYQAPEWLRIAVPLGLIALLQLLIVRLDIIMLSSLAGEEQAGVYAAASRFADLLIFALMAMNAIVAPVISRLHARGENDKLQQLLLMMARAMLLFVVPMLLFIGLFGDRVLALFGEDYLPAFYPLLILSAGQAVNALSGPVGFLLSMTGHQRQMLQVLMLAAGINLVLNLLLIPEYGITGAAISTAVTAVLWNLLLRWVVRRRLGVEPSVLALVGVRP